VTYKGRVLGKPERPGCSIQSRLQGSFLDMLKEVGMLQRNGAASKLSELEMLRKSTSLSMPHGIISRLYSDSSGLSKVCARSFAQDPMTQCLDLSLHVCPFWGVL